MRTDTLETSSPASAGVRRGQAAAERVFLVASGDNFPAVLTFCRALRRAGRSPAIIASGADDPIFRTDFARHVVHVRTRGEFALDDFAAGVRHALLRRGGGRCVLAPTCDALVTWAMLYRPGLAQLGCDLPLPYESVYERVRRPESFAEFCLKRGLSVVAPDAPGQRFTLFLHLPRAGRRIAYSQEYRASSSVGRRVVYARATNLHRRAEARRCADLLVAAGFEGVVAIELRMNGQQLAFVDAKPRLWDSLQLCLDGCPALLMSYISLQTGTKPPPDAWRPTRRRPEFQCRAGEESGRYAGVQPSTPSLSPTWVRTWGADFDFRTDSWRQFIAKCAAWLSLSAQTERDR